MTKIIAISGKSGCGNTTISTLLAERLGIKLINYTFRTLAQDRGISFEVLLAMAQKDTAFDRAVDEKQVQLAHESDCVVGSRLAMWLLPDALLRVYLWASPEVRASRIHSREGKTLEEIMAFTQKRDLQDHQRYLELYGIDNDDWSSADLTINSERYLPTQIAAIIESALQEKLMRAAGLFQR
jgi:cytidylate kinase